jgi:carbon-monoxide dehydrogenase large subunit
MTAVICCTGWREEGGDVIGESARRVEDRRLLTGAGRFTDDRAAEGAVHAAFVRSPHAHGEIRAMDKSEALSLPGVIGIFDGDDLGAANSVDTGIAGRGQLYPNRDGSAMADPPYHCLARGRVRHVGEPVALVIAETREAAQAAAEAVRVDYRPLVPVAGTAAATVEDAPQIWAEAPRNICYDWGAGDGVATQAALAAAAHVIIVEAVIPRVVPAFLEPRAALAGFAPETGRFTLFIGCQSVHGIRDKLAQTLGVTEDKVRVVSRDVGGAFGARSVLYPEYLAVLWAARQLGRPVQWMATRSEEFLTSTQGRDSILTGELGLDGDGNFLGLRVSGISNMGARHTGSGPYSVMRNLARMLPGVYRIPACRLELKGVFTNTVPMSSYRGVGRMEAIYVIERLVDAAARQLGFDRVELRRRNLIPADDLPWETAMGSTYDSGDYAANMDIAMDAADWAGVAARRAAAQKRGRLYGISLCNYIEGAGGGAGEYAAVTLDAGGRVSVGAGCVAQGQGHETTLAQIAADRLGLDADKVDVLASDTDLIAHGVGTNASRSMVRAGTALALACDRLIDDGRGLAAGLLQTDAASLSFAEGAYRGADGRAVGLFEVARARAEAEGAPCFAEVHSKDDTVTYPNGCHICEVEIDPETGMVEIVAFTAVDDVGRAINPRIVHGQSQGGIAQGIGQAISERAVHGADTGQPLAGSFMDYAIPRAISVPALRPISNDCPSPTNPLGVKGAGEGGATGAPAAVMNAILDALAPLGIDALDMPATPERVWRAINAGRGG